MSDHADIVREGIGVLHAASSPKKRAAHAALDALVAERDEYHNLLESEHMRAEAAEAEAARLREAIAEAMESIATGPMKGGYAYSVLGTALEEKPS